MDFVVPNYSSLINGLDNQIAAGPPKLDFSFISNALQNYDKGVQTKQDIGLRNMFQNGVPMNNGIPDYGAISKQLLQIGGASQIPTAINLGNAQIGRQVLQGTGLLPGGAASPPSSSTAIPSTGFGPQIASASGKYSLPNGFLTNQLSAESGMNPNAVSPKGATGIAQFMPGTAAQYGVNPNDPNSSIEGAAHYDSDLLRKYNNNQGLAAAAYNWGPANVDNWMANGANPAQMPRETQAYIAKVTGKPIQGWIGNGASSYQPQQVAQAAPNAMGAAPQSGSAGAPTSTEQQTALAARYQQVANALYQRAAGLAFINPTASGAMKSQADAYMQQALAINRDLARNAQLTPEQKNANASGAKTPLDYQASVESNKQDIDTFQKRYTGIEQLGQASYNGIQKAKLMKQLTLDPNFYSGPLNETVQTYKQFKAIFGSDPTSALPQEAFNKVANDMLTQQVKAMGGSGVGRVLQSEVNMMKQAIATLGITPAANRALATIIGRVYQQEQDIAGIARSLPQKPGQMNWSLDTAVQSYLQKNPLFTEQEIQDPRTLAAPDVPPQSAHWNVAQKRAWAARLGLKPGDPIRVNGQLGAVP